MEFDSNGGGRFVSRLGDDVEEPMRGRSGRQAS
jgi:hypothetical protein